MECPAIYFLSYIAYPVNKIGCVMEQYMADWEVFSLFSAGDSAAYCINKSGGLVYDELVFNVLGGDQALSWVSGDREIWFL